MLGKDVTGSNSTKADKRNKSLIKEWQVLEYLK